MPVPRARSSASGGAAQALQARRPKPTMSQAKARSPRLPVVAAMWIQLWCRCPCTTPSSERR